MEIKLQAFEKLLDQEKEAKQLVECFFSSCVVISILKYIFFRITDERAQELHAYLVQNNKLKQR